jgi:hypothetical protein
VKPGRPAAKVATPRPLGWRTTVDLLAELLDAYGAAEARAALAACPPSAKTEALARRGLPSDENEYRALHNAELARPILEKLVALVREMRGPLLLAPREYEKRWRRVEDWAAAIDRQGWSCRADARAIRRRREGGPFAWACKGLDSAATLLPMTELERQLRALGALAGLRSLRAVVARARRVLALIVIFLRRFGGIVPLVLLFGAPFGVLHFVRGRRHVVQRLFAPVLKKNQRSVRCCRVLLTLDSNGIREATLLQSHRPSSESAA